MSREKISADVANVGVPLAEVASCGLPAAQSVPYALECNQRMIDRTIAEARANAFDRNNPEDMKQYAKMLRESATDKARESEVAAYREYELSMDVMASQFALSAFQVANLSDDELPMIITPQSRNLNRYTIRSMSYDGGALQAQWRSTRTALTLEMETISSDRIQYPIMDIQQGDVNQFTNVNREMNYDMDMKIDTLALTNINAASTASGLRDLLSIHPLIDVNTIPDENFLDLNGSNAGVITLDKVKSICKFIAKLEAAYQQEGLKCKGIFLSPLSLPDFWDFVDQVSGIDGTEPDTPKDTVPRSVREQIFANGLFTQAYGQRLNWIPTNRLSVGKMIITFNKPLGWMFTKRQLDKVLQWNESNSPDHAEKNYGEVMYKRVLSFYVPDLWKHHIAHVDF